MWRLSFFFAFRYLFERRRPTFIHTLSWISMGMVAVGAFALVLGVSVFNGMEQMLRGHYARFEPDITLRKVNRTRFAYTDSLEKQWILYDEVEAYSPVIEDYALVRHGSTSIVAKIKGVRPSYWISMPLREYVYPRGQGLGENPPQALMGQGVQYKLRISGAALGTRRATLDLVYPTPAISVHQKALYRQQEVQGSAVFRTEQSPDEEYILVPLSLARTLFGASEKGCGSVEIRLKSGTDVENFARVLSRSLSTFSSLEEGGSMAWEVLTREALHTNLYKILRIEKAFVFLAFGFILMIGSLSLFFAFIMMYLSKRKDFSVLRALGCRPYVLGLIVFLQAMMVSFGGGIIGIGGALLAGYLQQRFGWVSLSASGVYAVPYPVLTEFSDVLWVLCTLIVLMGGASLRPMLLAIRSDKKVLARYLR